MLHHSEITAGDYERPLSVKPVGRRVRGLLAVSDGGCTVVLWCGLCWPKL